MPRLAVTKRYSSNKEGFAVIKYNKPGFNLEKTNKNLSKILIQAGYSTSLKTNPAYKKKSRIELLQEAQTWCDDNNKSTEFMIQYMQDYAKVSFDYVMDFLQNNAK